MASLTCPHHDIVRAALSSTYASSSSASNTLAAHKSRYLSLSPLTHNATCSLMSFRSGNDRNCIGVDTLASRSSRWHSIRAHASSVDSVVAVNGRAEEKEQENKAVPIEKAYPAFPTILDVNEIKEILPHRFPFLLVDRIIEFEPGKTAVGIKNVTINDNYFPGHFPDRPIMPGVLMVEALAQVGGIVMLSPEVGGSKDNFFFAGIDKVRFRKPVVAGDTLVMRMTLTQLRKSFGIAKMKGEAYVGGDLVCEGEFIMALGAS